MKKLTLISLALVGSILAACSAPAPTAAPVEDSPVPAAPAAPAYTATPVPPTTTPAPTLTATPAVYSGPASKFLPVAADFPDIYEAEGSLVSENLLSQAQIPVARENVGFASFRNKGNKIGDAPQTDIYFRFTYWVIVAPDETSAKLFYGMSGQPDYQKQAFLVIMPASVQEKMEEIQSIPAAQLPCDESSLRAVNSDVYAAFRKGPLPTRDPKRMGSMDPARLAKLPPDLYLAVACRVKNVVVMFWGYRPNDYDGKNSPIPADALAKQVNSFLQAVTSKLK